MPLSCNAEVLSELKPKGMLQILWERGCIDENNHKQCALKGKKDIFGNIVHESSSVHLVSIQKHSIEEKTFLQQSGNKIDAIIDREPKFHPELSGEGVDYSCGFSKLFYCCLPLNSKKKDKFNESVSNSVLRIERVSKLGKIARNFMIV